MITPNLTYVHKEFSPRKNWRDKSNRFLPSIRLNLSG